MIAARGLIFSCIAFLSMTAWLAPCVDDTASSVTIILVCIGWIAFVVWFVAHLLPDAPKDDDDAE